MMTNRGSGWNGYFLKKNVVPRELWYSISEEKI
jgi:hypothetical protein